MLGEQQPQWERTLHTLAEMARAEGKPSNTNGEELCLDGATLEGIRSPLRPTGLGSPRSVGLIGSPSSTSISLLSPMPSPRSPAMALGPGSPFLSAANNSSSSTSSDSSSNSSSNSGGSGGTGLGGEHNNGGMRGFGGFVLQPLADRAALEGGLATTTVTPVGKGEGEEDVETTCGGGGVI